MKPICLIIPPSVFLLDERVFLTLGILRVAACLERDGFPVEMLDLSGIENYEEAVRDHVGRSEARVFGLTATTPQMPAAVRIAAVIRREENRSDRTFRTDKKLILGGPHITLVNAALKRERRLGVENGRAARAFAKLEDCFDVLVAGDGEDSIFHALMPDAPKLVDGDDAASALFLTNERLDRMPFPARHLVDVDSYHYSIDGVPALSMIAQLGCPFACGFCGGRESAMLRRIRTRSTQHIVAEMVHLYRRYGIRGFMLYDDELNVNKQIVELMDAIATAQRDLGTEWRLRGFIKSQLFTDRQAEAMYRAGFRWILVGFESGSPRILENINKRATREENSRCMAIARRHGLKVKALMSIGHPGESAETVAATRDWLLEEKPNDFDCTIITTYPGTPYYDHAVRNTGIQVLGYSGIGGVWTYTYPKTGDRLHAYDVDFTEVADYYKGAPDGGYHSYVFTDFLSAEDLVRLRDELESDVRFALGIPFNAGAPGIHFEHSMGQGLPGNILRRTRGIVPIGPMQRLAEEESLVCA